MMEVHDKVIAQGIIVNGLPVMDDNANGYFPDLDNIMPLAWPADAAPLWWRFIATRIQRGDAAQAHPGNFTDERKSGTHKTLRRKAARYCSSPRQHRLRLGYATGLAGRAQ